MTKLLKSDPVDKTWNVLPALTSIGNKIVTKTQTGLLRSHAISFGIGVAVVLVLAMVMVV